MTEPEKNFLTTSPVVALAGWLVPGSGYCLIGQRARGITAGTTVLVLFVLGLLIGGMRVVDPPASYVSDPVNAAMQKPWFVGQILAGPIAPVAAAIGGAKDTPYVTSHARVNEIGTLYTAVAGMLNLLTIIDSAYRATRKGGRR